METFDYTLRYLGRHGREGFSDLEHLPPLLEDEENVSLADILSLRDRSLTEEEVWAVSGECVLALRSVQPTRLFHSLCITPDTLAFNAHGNACFMEQLSDDVEGSFVPPEFDHTGSTFEGHVFSLGSTLSAALDFVIEPELEAELGEEALRMLELMQAELPEDRPRPQDILVQMEQNLAHTTSSAVCRKLSSVGRRVLSMESVSNVHGAQDGSWEARWEDTEARCPFKRPVWEGDGSEDAANGVPDDSRCLSSSSSSSSSWQRWRACDDPWDPYLWAARMEEKEEPERPPKTGGGPRRSETQQWERGGRGVLNRSCSVPDSNNPAPPPPPPASRGDISVPVADLTEIGPDDDEEEEGGGRRRCLRGALDRGQSCECYPGSWEPPAPDPPRWVAPQEDRGNGEGECTCCSDAAVANGDHGRRRAGYGPEDDEENDDGEVLGRGLYGPNNHMTKSMLCLTEETQDEWISLRELLPRCGRRLNVNELWALCYTCLATLQTYIDFPAYLCLDTVYVGCEGEVLFLKPQNIGSFDAFYIAPEYQDHGIVTEKACVYGVAAILWATAKFSLSANQKLAVPRKLKRLLLEMAKRTPIERPSIVTAKKSCRDYLSRQGTSAEAVWAKLIDLTHQQHFESTAPQSPIRMDAGPASQEHSPAKITSGFVPLATESRLAPVPGPVPRRRPAGVPQLQLPEAFTSTATHFSPIVLTQEKHSEEEEEGTSKPGAAAGRMVDFTRNAVTQPKQEGGFDFTPCRENSPPRHTFVTHLNVCLAVEGHAGPTASGEGLHSNPLPASSDPPQHGTVTSLPVASATAHLNRFKTYLLCQHPTAGHLTLVPIGYPTSASDPSESTKPSLCPSPEQRQPPIDSKASGLTGSAGLQLQRLLPAFQDSGGSKILAEWPQGKDGEPGPGVCLHPALRDVMDLLKGEFHHESCVENGQEELAMGIGEYIFSLKDLHYQSFASLVRERLSDLYWEEDLLEVLHFLVGSSPAKLGSNETPPPASPVLRSSAQTKGSGVRESCLQDWLDLNGNPQPGSAGAGSTLQRTEPMYQDFEKITAEHDGHQAVSPGREPPMEAGVTRGGERPAGGGRHESPPPEELWPRGRGRRWAGGGASEDRTAGPASPGPPGTPGSNMVDDDDSSGCPDSPSFAERRVSPSGLPQDPDPDQGLGCGPSWALAHYGGEEFFGEEVVLYAQSLGRHAGSQCLDAKAQELQQQLVIENRNLRKTRSFYHKLLQQDRNKKGSESKLMLGKVSAQLEELRSKVEFLYIVKKYLEVLRVDQWGLEVALLPALADHHLGPSGRHDPDDPAVLSFGPPAARGRGRGRGPLQAGSPKGLMAYLYARDAAMDGYIQQLLYTYRYFCTSEQLLTFLMDRFITAVRSPDITGNNVKVLHRTLDLLEAWLVDRKLVDLTLKPSLLSTLEHFLNTEVAPVDIRGETLLAALHSPPRKRRSQGSESPISLDQEEDLLSLHSSVEDAEKRPCRWRVSRLVEPQGREAFSIAAALPVPCYGSLLAGPSGGSPRPQERLLPFSQSGHSAERAGQQLTLMQQEVFLGCHPVHFINSRAKGVRDSASSPNNISPAGGGGLLAGEETSPSDGFLQMLLAYGDSVTDWISAEIVSSDSVKAQAAMLTRFLLIGKHCYESRDFATATQVLAGLENVIVRQLPAWKHLPSKVGQVMEELRAVQVFLKSDDLCLMGGAQARGRRPTLPSARTLAMHVQQLERGAFTLPTGAYKWTKLRSIARVVSQVQAFQEVLFAYSPDRELQAYLRRRIQRFSTYDRHALTLATANNNNNDNAIFLQRPCAQRHPARRLHQETLRRVRANLQ